MKTCFHCPPCDDAKKGLPFYKGNGNDTMISDDDEVAKEGNVSEEDLLEVSEADENEEESEEAEGGGFDAYGNPIEE